MFPSKKFFPFKKNLNQSSSLFKKLDWDAKRGASGNISGVKLQVISGSREEKNPYIASLDRINNEKGYVKGNVRFVCHWINNAKSTFDNKVLYEFVSAIAQKQIIRNK